MPHFASSYQESYLAEVRHPAKPNKDVVLVESIRTVIMGAAGRDFHNFNVRFRNDENYKVVAFTAAQIPGIESRIYPPNLSGPLYPSGIPILPESQLADLIRDRDIDLVVFSYSDLSHEEVMHRASITLALGASFELLGSKATMLDARVPVISVCAVRTGAGKTTITRQVCRALRGFGVPFVVVRHPMPYGDLTREPVQVYRSYEDLSKFRCTIEEREEFEPHLDDSDVVFAGVDYSLILESAEKEVGNEGIIVWDGGNNDFPFFKSDLRIVVADPRRAGHELRYHPGEANVRMADIVVINKVDTAAASDIETVRRNVASLNPNAGVIETASLINVDDNSMIAGKSVLVVEDGPTVTHGELGYSVGAIAARQFGAGEIIDPRPYAVGSIKTTFEKYPNLDKVLPAMGYGEAQIKELEETINRCPVDTVIIGTPIDLRRFMSIRRPTTRVRYEARETRGSIAEAISRFVDSKRLPGRFSRIR